MADNVPVAAAPESRTRRRRTAIVAALAGTVAVAVAAAGIAVYVRSHPSGPPSAVGPEVSVAGPVLGPYRPNAPLPTTAGLAAALAGPLKQKDLGGHVSVEVADMATGKLLYGSGSTSPTTPASTMKLATTIAVLATRGPNYRITTRVVAGPHPGEVVLVGAGDPTLGATSSPTYPEGTSIQSLAAQVKRSLGAVKPTKVILDTSLFAGPSKGPGWLDSDVESDYLTRVYSLSTDGGRTNPSKRGDSKRYLNSATAAGAIFATYLGLPASAVSSGIAPKTPAGVASPSAPGAVLGQVQSPPIVRIVETMDLNSDNMLAEFMARQVALATGHPASFAGAAAAVTGELTKLGLPMRGVNILDGSGISHQDKLTPALLTAILSDASQPSHPALHALFTGLPVAAYSGTLTGRFKHAGTTNVDGMLRAKTGTLDGVSALAGYVIDSAGRPLIVVVLADKTPWIGAKSAIDKIGAAVRACGCGSPPG